MVRLGLVMGMLIFVAVLFSWTGPLGNYANLGGDDSHLYFVSPGLWAKHAANSVLDMNLAGYNGRTYFRPFLLVLEVLGWIGVNVQGVVVSLALAATAVGVALLVVEIRRKRDYPALAGAAIAGLIVAVAPMLLLSQWVNLLFSVYWLPLLPWLLLCVCWHQRTGHLRWIFVCAALCAVAAPAINAVPWTLPCAIAVVGLFGALVVSGAVRFRLGRLAALIVAVALLNAFWVVPSLPNLTTAQTQFSVATGADARAVGEQIVRTLSPLQRPFDAIGLRLSRPMLEVYASPVAEPDRWPSRLWPLGLVPCLLLLVGLSRVFLAREEDEVAATTSAKRDGGRIAADSIEGLPALARFIVRIYDLGPRIGRMRLPVDRRLAAALALLTGLLVVLLYCVTTRTAPGGPRLFIFLLNHVPGWNSMRNFYDKFAIPYVMVFAVAAGVATSLFLEIFGYMARRVITTILLVSVLIYGGPSFLGGSFDVRYFGELPYTRAIDGLPDDYERLLDGLRRLPGGAVVSLPFLLPAWSVVKRTPEDTYLGLSPIYFLTGRYDYNGVDAFSSSAMPYLHGYIQRVLNYGDVYLFLNVLGQIGVKYVVDYPVPAPQALLRRLGPTTNLAIDERLNAALREAAPKVVLRSGEFVVRELADRYQRARVSLYEPTSTRLDFLPFIEDRPEPCTGSIDPTVDGRTRLVVGMKTPTSCAIVLREPFSERWVARFGDELVGSERAFGFANAFMVPKGWRGEVSISYTAAALPTRGLVISLLSLMSLLAFAARSRLRRLVPGLGAPSTRPS